MAEICRTESEGQQEDSVVSFARAHAASIRRTLFVRAYKREHGRSLESARTFACEAPSSTRRYRKLRKRDDPPPVIDGPIYSTEFWRKWKSRSKAGARGESPSHVRNKGCKAGNDNNGDTQTRVRCPRRSGTANERGSNAPRAKSTTSSKRTSRSAMYTNPTSSFAGGRTGTQIFAAISGGSDCGQGLLQAHHDAVIQPLMKWGYRDAARSSSSSQGVRLSNSNPRSSDVHSSERSAGDGMYDITLADKVVMRAATSFSFRDATGQGCENTTDGISRDTPGPIYNPKITSSCATLLSPADRFPVRHIISGTPGPGHYSVSGASKVEKKHQTGPGAVAWTGVDTLMDSEWCRPVAPPRLRPWRGFGNGCSVQEHIDYGACLDGRCCTRHSVERKNALRVVQFLERGSRQGRRRHRRQHQDRPVNERRDQSKEQPSNVLGSAVGRNLNVSAEVGGRDSAGSSPLPGSSTSSPVRGNFSVVTSPAENDAAGGSPNTSSVVSCGEGSVGVGSPAGARNTVRKRTPLHFASEMGELALVDRLCCQGDDRNALDERGFTPLHDAAEQGNTRVVNRLLQGEENMKEGERHAEGSTLKRPRQIPADPNVQDNKGRTPLYLACLRGQERVVRALLNAGACSDLVDTRGRPAQEVAGAQKIYQLLQFKADVSLVKANITALEERERRAERHREETTQAEAVKELANLKAEELRLRGAVAALEKKRLAYAMAAKAQP